LLLVARCAGRYGKDSAIGWSWGPVSLQRYRTLWFWWSQNCNSALAVTVEAWNGSHQGLLHFCFLVLCFCVLLLNALMHWDLGLKYFGVWLHSGEKEVMLLVGNNFYFIFLLFLGMLCNIAQQLIKLNDAKLHQYKFLGQVFRDGWQPEALEFLKMFLCHDLEVCHAVIYCILVRLSWYLCSQYWWAFVLLYVIYCS